MAHEENLAAAIMRMSDDRDFTVDVRRRYRLAQLQPAQRVWRLPVQGHLGMVVRVNKEEVVRFVVRQQAVEEPLMAFRDDRHVATETVGIERFHTAELQPPKGRLILAHHVQHHLFVIAHQWLELAMFTQRDQTVDNTFAVGASVDVIAKRYNGIVRLRVDGLQQRIQSDRAAVDVANRDKSSAHRKFRSNLRFDCASSQAANFRLSHTSSMSAIPGESVLGSAALASGLVSAQGLDYAQRVARHRLQQTGHDKEEITDRLLAEILIEQEMLTPYQADQLMAGRTKLNLGPYIVTDWIAQGGMGQVYKAVHQVMGRVCAVKVLPLSRATQLARDSFMREIRMQAKLDCPYLVRAYDAGQDGKIHYLVTEYVPGMDLRRLVRQRGPLSVQQSARIIMQAALGLEYAHSKGLIHRDVKPGNILVTPEGDAKVSDVGLAGFNRDLLSDPRAGKIVGTTDYISPEQIRTPLEISPAADIYSLGCTLYYAVCGKVPFPGGDTHSKLKRHLEETPWHPRRFVPDIPEEFVDIIADMMDKHPEKRIGSAREVVARLEPWAGDRTAGMSTARMGHSPWMAPPPPMDQDNDSQAEPIEEVQAQESSAGGFGPANFGPTALPIEALKELGSPREPGSGLAPGSAAVPLTQLRRMTPTMIVALTLAIAIPPALVVGAILGYLLSRHL